MLRNPDGRCWNDIRKRWEACPPLTPGTGRGREFVTNPFERCCLEQGCCINCFQLTSFVNCITNIFWNDVIWGWSNPDSGTLTPVAWFNAYRSWTVTPNGCLMKPEAGISGTLPAPLYFEFPGSEACYTLTSVNYTSESFTPNLVIGDEAVTCFTFTSNTPGCLDFSVCWRYRFDSLGGGNWQRVLLETKVCINGDVSGLIGRNGSLVNCEACSSGATPTPPCLIGLENPLTANVENIVTVNIGDISLTDIPVLFDWQAEFGQYLNIVVPPCCTDASGVFNVNFDATHFNTVNPGIPNPPLTVGNNDFNVLLFLSGNLGSGVITIRYVTTSCDRFTFNIVYNIIA